MLAILAGYRWISAESMTSIYVESEFSQFHCLLSPRILRNCTFLVFRYDLQVVAVCLLLSRFTSTTAFLLVLVKFSFVLKGRRALKLSTYASWSLLKAFFFCLLFVEVLVVLFVFFVAIFAFGTSPCI